MSSSFLMWYHIIWSRQNYYTLASIQWALIGKRSKNQCKKTGLKRSSQRLAANIIKKTIWTCIKIQYNANDWYKYMSALLTRIYLYTKY